MYILTTESSGDKNEKGDLPSERAADCNEVIWNGTIWTLMESQMSLPYRKICILMSAPQIESCTHHLFLCTSSVIDKI